MKKKSLILFVFLLVAIAICILLFCFWGGEEMSRFTAYDLNRDVFYSFIESPSMDILNQQDMGTLVYTFSKTPFGKIQRERISEDTVITEKAPSGEFRLSYNNLIDMSLVNFVGNEKEIAKYLNKNGVSGNLESISCISTMGIPMAIWVRVDNDNYFITISENYDEDYDENGESRHIYRFYTQSEYLEKFLPKDSILNINVQNTTNLIYAKIHFSDIELPLIEVLKRLDFNIEWRDDNIADLTYKNQKFVLDLLKVSLCKMESKSNYITSIKGGYIFCKIINKEIFVNSWVIQNIMYDIGEPVQINIDNENLIVTITDIAS